MIHTPFDQIDATTIEKLIKDGVSESKHIDYKEQVHLGKDAQKKEFLADVSSFANAGGGHLIFGVREKQGVPVQVTGLGTIDMDGTILAMEDLARNGIEPRVPGIQSKAITGNSLPGPVIIMQIPRSWAAPHMVTLQKTSRFYSRTSNGKYPLDVHEIRAAFAMSEDLPRRIQRFRDERLGRIVANEGPLNLEDKPRVVMHVIPAGALVAGDRLTVEELATAERFIRLPKETSGNSRPNIDGLLLFTGFGMNRARRNYVQLFRNGSVELVAANITEKKLQNLSNKELPASVAGVPSTTFEEEISRLLDEVLAFLRNVGVDPPLLVMLALLGFRGMTIWSPADEYMDVWDGPGESFFDRDTTIVPEVVVEDLSQQGAVVLRPAFDTIWQAAGFYGCPNYDENGNRTTK